MSGAMGASLADRSSKRFSVLGARIPPVVFGLVFMLIGYAGLSAPSTSTGDRVFAAVFFLLGVLT